MNRKKRNKNKLLERELFSGKSMYCPKWEAYIWIALTPRRYSRRLRAQRKAQA